MTPGYTDELLFASGGNPYGASSSEDPTDAELAAARYLGGRVAGFAGRLAG